MKYLYWLTSFLILFAAFLFVSYKNQFLIHRVVTDSMEPTMMIGDWFINVPVFISYDPKVGDVVEYSCITEKCFKKTPHDDVRGIAHRITAIDPNGCMKIIGDNPKYSQSWENLPCYMPGEIEIDGVIHKLF